MINVILGVGIPLLYLAIGLLGGRTFYRHRIRAGLHDSRETHYGSSFARYYDVVAESNKDDSALGAGLTVFFWPGWALIGLYLLARHFVTANPPASPKELRQAREKLQRQIKDLEREVGMKVEGPW